ncbi:hypothetical protein A3L12_00480 [Thermococcus sp. P6]|uniref:ASCH domain-containing protein n=1 Tax=Thermococcus sp. P6 TaxID=122420 RepID=UPI000B599242|nr:ASCH domain-containing protein [Thermococcus sp. P6]ASJ09882.1 hypothetical protein A3L12_00480 [Thermococcus sp. P6]
MEHVIAIHQVYAELIFRGLKTVELRKTRTFDEGDTVFLYIARGNGRELVNTFEKLGLHREQVLTGRGTIAGGFEVGEVMRADVETLWEVSGEESGLTIVHGEGGKRWLEGYLKDHGYAFTIERPFLFKKPLSREEIRERYGVNVEGIIHISGRTRKPWVRALLEDLLLRERVYL